MEADKSRVSSPQEAKSFGSRPAEGPRGRGFRAQQDPDPGE
jgi:hypothetical protein